MLDRVRQIRINRPSRLGLGYGAVLLVIVFLYCWQLGSYTTGLGASESTMAQASQSWQSISEQPVNAPYKVLQLGLSWLGLGSVMGIRLVSALLAIAFIVSFWRIAKEWFGPLIGSFGVLLLASTPWLLINGRLATANILLLIPLLLLVNCFWLLRSRRRKNLAWLCLCITAAAALYVPGVFLLVLGVAIFMRKRLVAAIKPVNNWLRAAGGLLAAALVSPLAIAIFNDWSVIKPILLIPEFWPGLSETLKNVGWSALSAFWQTAQPVEFSVGRWPMLNVLQAVLTGLGMAIMFQRARQLCLGLIAVTVYAIVGSGLNNNLALLLIALPALVLFQAAGLRYLYLEWRSIFPKNPIPQTFALLLLCMLVAAQVVYGARFALDAWPNTPATRTSYEVIK